MAIIIMLGQPLYMRGWDTYLAVRPFVTATIEITRFRGQEKPMILYDADAKQVTDAIWTVVIQDADGKNFFIRKGVGYYSNLADNPRLWSWDSFFDNEKGLAPPDVPNYPFRICISFDSTARDSGVHDETPPTCTKTFHP